MEEDDRAEFFPLPLGAVVGGGGGCVLGARSSLLHNTPTLPPPSPSRSKLGKVLVQVGRAAAASALNIRAVHSCCCCCYARARAPLRMSKVCQGHCKYQSGK
jgi:hypothetical protein